MNGIPFRPFSTTGRIILDVWPDKYLAEGHGPARALYLASPQGLPEEPGPAALGSARLLHPAVRHSSFYVDQLVLLGHGWSLDRLSVVLLYLIGVAGLILVLTSIYLVMPPRGRIRPPHALIGGIAVGLLWDATRHILVWYFSTLSVVGVFYGSRAPP